MTHRSPARPQTPDAGGVRWSEILRALPASNTACLPWWLQPLTTSHAPMRGWQRTCDAPVIA